jgi:hypothetical protein
MVRLNNSEKNRFFRRTALCAAMAFDGGHPGLEYEWLGHSSAGRPKPNDFLRITLDWPCRDAFAREVSIKNQASPVNVFFGSDVECTDCTYPMQCRGKKH